MNKYGVKAAACALVGTLSLSGYQTTLEAKIHGSSDVPAAGVAVVMDEGSTIQDLQVEVVQNIAYLKAHQVCNLILYWHRRRLVWQKQ